MFWFSRASLQNGLDMGVKFFLLMGPAHLPLPPSHYLSVVPWTAAFFLHREALHMRFPLLCQVHPLSPITSQASCLLSREVLPAPSRLGQALRLASHHSSNSLIRCLLGAYLTWSLRRPQSPVYSKAE